MKDIVHRRCCGLDVHKDSIAACARWVDDKGDICKDARVFGTTTQELESLAGWMRHHEMPRWPAAEGWSFPPRLQTNRAGSGKKQAIMTQEQGISP